MTGLNQASNVGSVGTGDGAIVADLSAIACVTTSAPDTKGSPQIKRAYGAANEFHLNQNITPAAR